MEIPPPSCHFFMQGGNTVDHRHGLGAFWRGEGSGGHGRFDEFCPIAHAHGDHLVIEVEGRVMESGAGGIARAQEDEGTGPGFQHEGKVLAPHDRRHIGHHSRVSCNLARDLGGKGGFIGMVDGDGIFALVGQRGLGTVKGCRALHHLVQTLFPRDRGWSG